MRNTEAGRRSPIPARFSATGWQSAEARRTHQLAERATLRRQAANHGALVRATWAAALAAVKLCPVVPRAQAGNGDLVGRIAVTWGRE